MFRRAAAAHPPRGEEENPYLLSFADIMAGLLGLFILALISVMLLLDQQKQRLARETSVTQEQREKLRAALVDLGRTVTSIRGKIAGISAYEAARAELLTGVEATLAREGIVVNATEDGLRIPDETLSFPKGSHDVPPEMRRSAERIGAVLKETLERPEYAELLDTIFVEGHTDSVPNRRGMGNWELSAQRAISLWHFWTDAVGPAPELRARLNSRKEPLFSVSGYADTRPVIAPSAEALRVLELPAPTQEMLRLLDEPKNRRIDLRFTLRGSEEVRAELEKEVKELEALQQRLQSTLGEP